MMFRKTLVFAALLGASPVWAADFSDPTWPCVQRKVERLSVGLMWPQPIPETVPEDAALRGAIDALATRLSMRRIPVQDIRPEVAAFAATQDDAPALLGLVFDDVFDSLSSRRSQIISGIGEFSLSQIALSERIEAARREMDAEMAKDEPDFDRVDALEEQLDWDQTIYSDRQQSITYLCETPVLLEKRLFEIAQMLQAEAQGG